MELFETVEAIDVVEVEEVLCAIVIVLVSESKAFWIVSRLSSI